MARIDTDSFRRRLLARRDELCLEHGATLQQVGRSGDHVTPDSVDLASETSEFDVAVSAANIEGQELEAIDDALERIERGDFGRCEECGQAIGAKRLEALPCARRCIGCQRALEEGRDLVLDEA